MILQQLVPEHAKQAWPLIQPYLESLADRFPEDWPIDVLKQQIAEQYVVVWVIWDETNKRCHGLGLTELQTKPSGRKALHIHAVGENHKDWVHLITELEKYGTEQGADMIEVVGRRGWEKSLTDYSKQQLALFTKDLVNGTT